MQSPGLRRRGWGPRPPAPCSQPFPQNQAELLVRCFLLFFFFPFFLLISRPPLPHAHTRTRRERRGGRDLKPNIQLTVRRGCCLEKKVQLCGLSGLQQRPPALTETSGLRAPPGHRGCGRRATGREPSSLALRPRGMQTPSHPLLSLPILSLPILSHPFPRIGRARDGRTPGTGRGLSPSEGRPAAAGKGDFGGAQAAASSLGVCAWRACSRLPWGSGSVSCLQPAPSRNGEMEFKQRSWVSRALNWSFAQSLRAIESIWKSIYRQCGGQIMDSSQ